MDQPPNHGSINGNNGHGNIQNTKTNNNDGEELQPNVVPLPIPQITQFDEEESSTRSDTNISPHRQTALTYAREGEVVEFNQHTPLVENQLQVSLEHGSQPPVQQVLFRTEDEVTKDTNSNPKLPSGDGGDGGDNSGDGDSSDTKDSSGSDQDRGSSDSEESNSARPNIEINKAEPRRKSQRTRRITEKALAGKSNNDEELKSSCQDSNLIEKKLGSKQESSTHTPHNPSPLATSARRGKQGAGYNREQGPKARLNKTTTYLDPKNHRQLSYTGTSHRGRKIGGKQNKASVTSLRTARMSNLSMNNKTDEDIEASDEGSTQSQPVNSHGREGSQEQEQNQVSKDAAVQDSTTMIHARTIVQGSRERSSKQSDQHNVESELTPTTVTWTGVMSTEEADVIVNQSGMDRNFIVSTLESQSMDEVADIVIDTLRSMTLFTPLQMTMIKKKLLSSKQAAVKWFEDMFECIRMSPPRRTPVHRDQPQVNPRASNSGGPPAFNSHAGPQSFGNLGGPCSQQINDYNNFGLSHPGARSYANNLGRHHGFSAAGTPASQFIGNRKSPPETQGGQGPASAAAKAKSAETQGGPGPASAAAKAKSVANKVIKTKNKSGKKRKSDSNEDLFKNNWNDNSDNLPQAKYSYESMIDRVPGNRFTHQGTIFYHRKNDTWYVTHTEYGEKEIDKEHNRIGPNAFIRPVSQSKKVSGTRIARAGMSRWSPKRGSIPQIHEMSSFYPTNPRQYPNFLTNRPGALLPSPSQNLAPLTHALGVHSWSTLYGKNCGDHPDGCGLSLEVGDIVVIDGSDTCKANGMTYCVGVFKLGPSLKRKCKVGQVQILGQHLNEVTNQYGQVTYVCPREGVMNIKGKDFPNIVKGYFHVALMNTQTGPVPSTDRVQRHKSKGTCCAETEQECRHNEYRHFDIELPMQDDLARNKATANRARNSRGGKSSEKSKKEREEDNQLEEGSESES